MGERVDAKEFDCTLCSQPCESWARLKFANGRGPGPVRSRAWPHGFPWNKPPQQAEADAGSAHVGVSINLLKRERAAGGDGLLEHPEDLGSHCRGHPASVWQLPELRSLSALGFRRGALSQSDVAEVDYLKPTGLYATFLDHLGPELHRGWPIFAVNNSGNHVYKGPLPEPPGAADARRRQAHPRATARGQGIPLNRHGGLAARPLRLHCARHCGGMAQQEGGSA